MCDYEDDIKLMPMQMSKVSEANVSITRVRTTLIHKLAEITDDYKQLGVSTCGELGVPLLQQRWGLSPDLCSCSWRWRFAISCCPSKFEC